GAFARYRLGDVFKCESLTREQDGIMLPHFKYVDRIAPVIDLAGFTRITEGTITEVIKLSKLDIHDWFAVKRYDSLERPFVDMYVELDHKSGFGMDNVDLIRDQLEIYFRYIDEDYKNLKKMLGIDPLQVHIMPFGTIERYRRTIKHTLFKVNPNYFDVTEILKLASTGKGGEPYC
ncbi:MAG: auxin-responsive protein, partial [Firmicutes bacterium HGW-Firmicutes-20]